MECKVHPQQTITNYFIASGGSGIIRPMCPICVEEHSHMKREKGEYLSYQNIKEDAINEIANLKQRLNDNINSMQRMTVNNGGVGLIDTKLAKIRQTLINQVDFVISSIKQDIMQDGDSQCNSDHLLKQFIQDQNYLVQLENEIQRRNQQAIIDLYQNRIIKDMQHNFEQAERMRSNMDNHHMDIKLKDSQLKDFRRMLSDLIVAKSNRHRHKVSQRLNTYANDSADQTTYNKNSFKYYLDNEETIKHKPIVKMKKYKFKHDDCDNDCDSDSLCDSQSDSDCSCDSVPIVTHHPIVRHQPVPVQVTSSIGPSQQSYIGTPQRQSANIKPILKASNVSQMSFNQSQIVQQPQMIQQSYHVQQPKMLQQSKIVQQPQMLQQSKIVQQPQLVHQQVKQSQIMSSSRNPIMNSQINYVPNQQVNLRSSRVMSRQNSLSSSGVKQVNIGQSKISSRSNSGIGQVNIGQSKIMSRSNSGIGQVNIGQSKISSRSNSGIRQSSYLQTPSFNTSYQQSRVLGPQYNQYGLQTNQPQYGLQSNQLPSSQVYQLQTVNGQNSSYVNQNVQMPQYNYQRYDSLLQSGNKKSSLKSSYYSPGKSVKFQDQAVNSIPNYSQNQV